MVNILNNLSDNIDHTLKYKPLDEAALKKLKNDLQPYLKDKDLNSLRLLIQKTESYSIDEIENIIFTNLSLFQPLTHHRIRDFVRRRIRKDRTNTVEGNVIYRSDDSNLVSPYSRDSFSSTSKNIFKKIIPQLILIRRYEFISR